MLFKNIIKKIKNYDELELNYAYLSSDYNNLEEKYINLKKLYETLEEENILLEKRRRSNAGAVGGLTATNNKLRKQIKLLTNDLAYAIKIIKELNKENQKLKNPTTMQQIYEYERTAINAKITIISSIIKLLPPNSLLSFREQLYAPSVP